MMMDSQEIKLNPHHSEQPPALRVEKQRSSMSYKSDVGMIPETETMQQQHELERRGDGAANYEIGGFANMQ